MEEVSFRQVVSRGCGIDVHQKVVVATIGGGKHFELRPASLVL